MPQHEQTMQRLAVAHRVPFVSTVGAFAAKLAGSARSEWFGDEIHCTARGYQLMADLVADHLAARRR